MITSPVEKLQFTITGLPQVLPITFAFGLPSDLLVLDGTNLLTISSDYLVTGGNGAVGNVQVAAGGAGNVQVGDIITVMRNVPLTQLTDFTSTGVLTAAMIGQALDKLTEITQQLSEEVGRCLRFPPNENEDGTMGLATRAGLLVGFDASGNLIFTTSAGGGGGGGGSSVTGFYVNNSVTQLTGGTSTCMDGIATATLTIPTLAPFVIGGAIGWWLLQTSSQAPGYGCVQPIDNANLRWIQVG